MRREQAVPARNITATIATTFGTKVMVISCTWVTACSMATMPPTTNAATIDGPATIAVTRMASPQSVRKEIASIARCVRPACGRGRCMR